MGFPGILWACGFMEGLIDKWHEHHETLFISKGMFADPFRHYAHDMVHANYYIWHCIEGYCDRDTNRVLYVYNQGLEYNKIRNAARDEIDQILCKQQNGTGPFNSESIGSILDRISNAYIKELHLRDNGDKRLDSVIALRGRLQECAIELWDDMLAGRRQCFTSDSFKIEYPSGGEK